MKDVSARAGIFSLVKRAVVSYVIAVKFKPGPKRPLFCVHIVIWAAEKFVIMFVAIRFPRKGLILEGTSLKKLHEGITGGRSIGPLPSSFDTIHPIDLIFGTYNKLSLYFQLIETMWCHNWFPRQPQLHKRRHMWPPSWVFTQIFGSFTYSNWTLKWWENII